MARLTQIEKINQFIGISKVVAALCLPDNNPDPWKADNFKVYVTGGGIHLVYDNEDKARGDNPHFIWDGSGKRLEPMAEVVFALQNLCFTAESGMDQGIPYGDFYDEMMPKLRREYEKKTGKKF